MAAIGSILGKAAALVAEAERLVISAPMVEAGPADRGTTAAGTAATTSTASVAVAAAPALQAWMPQVVHNQATAAQVWI